MTYQETEAALKTATAKFNDWKKINNENGAGFNPYEDEVCELSKKLVEIKTASSPLVTDLAAERAAFNAQKFTRADLQKAAKWCLDRGYSLAELQAAIKKAK